MSERRDMKDFQPMPDPLLQCQRCGHTGRAGDIHACHDPLQPHKDRRERIATAVFLQLCTSDKWLQDSWSDIAMSAANAADALIGELDGDE